MKVDDTIQMMNNAVKSRRFKAMNYHSLNCQIVEFDTITESAGIICRIESYLKT